MPEPAALPTPSLLIAVTGGPGTSKTRRLAELAAAQVAAGQRVEGVLSIAGNRTTPKGGANEYWLRIMGSDSELPWATRDEALNPPYFFEPGTGRKLQVWAERLRSLPPPPLLILDEFGKFEVRGLGLMPVWPPARGIRAPHHCHQRARRSRRHRRRTHRTEIRPVHSGASPGRPRAAAAGLSGLR